MLQCCFSDYQKDWDISASILTDAYNSQKHGSTNTRQFDLVPNRRISHSTSNSTLCTVKMLTSAQHQAEFLAMLQRSFDRARIYSRPTQERHRMDFDWLRCNGRKMIRTDDYVSIKESDKSWNIDKDIAQQRSRVVPTTYHFDTWQKMGVALKNTILGSVLAQFYQFVCTGVSYGGTRQPNTSMGVFKVDNNFCTRGKYGISHSNSWFFSQWPTLILMLALS